MKWITSNRTKIVCVLFLIIISLRVTSCSPLYEGNGILLKSESFSFFPYYEINFPPFLLTQKKIIRAYRFRGVENRELTIRFYLLSESEKRIQFKIGQKIPEFIEDLKIAVRLLENGKEVINVEQADWIFVRDLYYLSPGKNYLVFQFSSHATYELQVAVNAKENSPVSVNMQFAIGEGYFCRTKSCEEVMWDNLIKN